MITPSQMNPSSPDYFLIDQLEQEIDNAVKRNHRRNLYENRPYEGGFTSTTYPPHICYGVAHKYYNAGWKYVYYKTNTDRNTTAFLLSMTPLDNKITDIVVRQIK